jgi:hypothetical protein
MIVFEKGVTGISFFQHQYKQPLKLVIRPVVFADFFLVLTSQFMSF